MNISIHFYSPKYVSTNIIIYISQLKRLTGEQLIGIVCGSTAVIFIALYIIITIYRRKKLMKTENENSYSISSSFKEYIKKEEKENEMLQADDCNGSQSTDEDSDIDFWI